MNNNSLSKKEIGISFIIVNYNLAREIENCLNSILPKIEYEKTLNYEILIVDNNSPEKVLPQIESKFLKDNIHFFYLGTNIGFGKACNYGFSHAAGKYICFLNPDIIVNENIFENLFDLLERTFSDNKNGIIGLNVCDKILLDYSAGLFPGYLFEILNIFSISRYCEAIIIRLKVKLSKTKIIKVGWVMGAALFIKRDIFNSINGFDPDYFLYFEEMDLCKRLNRKGLFVKYFANIKIDHIGSAGSKKNYYFFTKMFYKGKLIFLKKHSSPTGFYLHQKLMFLHIFNQIVFWWFLQPIYAEKSGLKIRAFKGFLKNINYPERITNTQ